MDSVTIILPLPHKMLSPNYTVGSKGQRMAKAAKVKRYREVAAALTREKLPPDFTPWERAVSRVTVHMPRRVQPDRDNFAASLKPCWDGMTDAGLLPNDRYLVPMPVEYGYVDAVWPRVVVVVTKQPDTGEEARA